MEKQSKKPTCTQDSHVSRCSSRDKSAVQGLTLCLYKNQTRPDKWSQSCDLSWSTSDPFPCPSPKTQPPARSPRSNPAEASLQEVQIGNKVIKINGESKKRN